MPLKNEITGDELRTGKSTSEYRENYSKIFGKSKFELRLEAELKDKENEQRECNARHGNLLDK